MRHFPSLIRKAEPYLFLLVVFVLVSENFICKWIITADGPAHLYNSMVFADLLNHPSGFLSSFFEINTNPVPNSFDHLFLALVSSFVSYPAAIKIYHVLIVAGICYSFRFLSRQINPEHPFASWLILPFCQTAIFFSGFYNFESGIALAMLACGIWLYLEKRNARWWQFLLLSILCIVLYSSHLVPFLLTAGIICSRTLLLLRRKEYSSFFRRAITAALVLLPAFLVFLVYYINRSETAAPPRWADHTDSIMRLVSLQHIYIHEISQALYAQLLAILLIGAGLFSAFVFFRKRKTLSAEVREEYGFWFFGWLILLALVFISPDDFGGSGAMTLRLIEISWVLLLVFISTAVFRERVFIILAGLSAFFALAEFTFHHDSIAARNYEVRDVGLISESIAPGKTAAYISLSSNEFKKHLGELAFLEKKTALLSNYETAHDFFIVKWNPGFPADYRIGGLKSADLRWAACLWPEAPGKPEKNIDYVLLYKEHINDSAAYKRLNDTLNKYYGLKNKQGAFSLYEAR